MTIWFTSDMHFGHVNIIKLADRPFSDVENMNRVLVSNWNSVVDDDDEVFVLGDAIMGKFADGLEVAKTLKGRKTLVPGNHDRCHPHYNRTEDKRLKFAAMYEEAGFEIAPIQLEWIKVGPGWLDICHFPYSGDSHGEDRYVEYRPRDQGRWLLHGHVHNAWKVNGRQINVGCDVWDFTPVSLDTLLDLMV